MSRNLSPLNFPLYKGLTVLLVVGTIASLGALATTVSDRCTLVHSPIQPPSSISPTEITFLCSLSQTVALAQNPTLIANDIGYGFWLIYCSLVLGQYPQFGLYFILVGGAVLLVLLKVLR